MTTLEMPQSAVLSARERRVRLAPSVAQRGSTLTEASWGVQPNLSSEGEPVNEIHGLPPAWFQPTVEKLGRLLTMQPGWDSYGATKINPACVQSALEIAFAIMKDETPPPAVVPTSCGGVQLEWHIHGIDLEIEFRSPTHIQASCEDQRTGEAWDEQVFDFTRIRRILREMARR